MSNGHNPKNEISSPVEMMKMFRGFQVSRILLTAYELDVFTMIDEKPLSAESITSILNADVKGIERLMNALVGLGFIFKKDGMFSNSSLVSRFLVKGKSEYWSGMGHTNNLWKTWSNLTDVILSRDHAFSTQINDRTQDWLRNFIYAMHSRAKNLAIDVEQLIEFNNVKKLLDVGGGSGIFASTFVRKNPGTSAVVFDLPNVIPITQEFIDKENLGVGVTTLIGNYLKDDIGNNYDLIFLSAIIHSNSEDENQLLFKKCYNALNQNGKIVVVDFAMSEDRTEPLTGAIFAINMLVGTENGDTYTKAEISDWLIKAGFIDIEVKEAYEGNSMVTGWKR